jgi:hypothetical protein
LGAITLLVSGFLAWSDQRATWALGAEEFALEAVAENTDAQGLPISADFLKLATRIRVSGESIWPPAAGAPHATPHVHLLPPKNVACRHLRLALRSGTGKEGEADALELTPLAVGTIGKKSGVNCGDEPWLVTVGEPNQVESQTKPATSVLIEFPRAERVEVFEHLRARALTTKKLVGRLNPWEAFKVPLQGRELQLVATPLHVGDVAVGSVETNGGMRPALVAQLRAPSYEKFELDGKRAQRAPHELRFVRCREHGFERQAPPLAQASLASLRRQLRCA